MHIDFLGPLTQTLNGNSYVGLAVCALTKYVEAAGKIANTKLTFFKHQNTLEIQTYYNRGGVKFFFEYILKYVSYVHNFFPAQRTTLKTPSTYLEHDHKANRKIFRTF